MDEDYGLPSIPGYEDYLGNLLTADKVINTRDSSMNTQEQINKRQQPAKNLYQSTGYGAGQQIMNEQRADPESEHYQDPDERPEVWEDIVKPIAGAAGDAGVPLAPSTDTLDGLGEGVKGSMQSRQATNKGNALQRIIQDGEKVFDAGTNQNGYSFGGQFYSEDELDALSSQAGAHADAASEYSQKAYTDSYHEAEGFWDTAKALTEPRNFAAMGGFMLPETGAFAASTAVGGPLAGAAISYDQNVDSHKRAEMQKAGYNPDDWRSYEAAIEAGDMDGIESKARVKGTISMGADMVSLKASGAVLGKTGISNRISEPVTNAVSRATQNLSPRASAMVQDATNQAIQSTGAALRYSGTQAAVQPLVYTTAGVMNDASNKELAEMAVGGFQQAFMTGPVQAARQGGYGQIGENTVLKTQEQQVTDIENVIADDKAFDTRNADSMQQRAGQELYTVVGDTASATTEMEQVTQSEDGRRFAEEQIVKNKDYYDRRKAQVSDALDSVAADAQRVIEQANIQMSSMTEAGTQRAGRPTEPGAAQDAFDASFPEPQGVTKLDKATGNHIKDLARASKSQANKLQKEIKDALAGKRNGVSEATMQSYQQTRADLSDAIELMGTDISFQEVPSIDAIKNSVKMLEADKTQFNKANQVLKSGLRRHPVSRSDAAAGTAAQRVTQIAAGGVAGVAGAGIGGMAAAALGPLALGAVRDGLRTRRGNKALSKVQAEQAGIPQADQQALLNPVTANQAAEAQRAVQQTDPTGAPAVVTPEQMADIANAVEESTAEVLPTQEAVEQSIAEIAEELGLTEPEIAQVAETMVEGGLISTPTDWTASEAMPGDMNTAMDYTPPAQTQATATPTASEAPAVLPAQGQTTADNTVQAEMSDATRIEERDAGVLDEILASMPSLETTIPDMTLVSETEAVDRNTGEMFDMPSVAEMEAMEKFDYNDMSQEAYMEMTPIEHEVNDPSVAERHDAEVAPEMEPIFEESPYESVIPEMEPMDAMSEGLETGGMTAETNEKLLDGFDNTAFAKSKAGTIRKDNPFMKMNKENPSIVRDLVDSGELQLAAAANVLDAIHPSNSQRKDKDTGKEYTHTPTSDLMEQAGMEIARTVVKNDPTNFSTAEVPDGKGGTVEMEVLIDNVAPMKKVFEDERHRQQVGGRAFYATLAAFPEAFQRGYVEDFQFKPVELADEMPTYATETGEVRGHQEQWQLTEAGESILAQAQAALPESNKKTPMDIPPRPWLKTLEGEIGGFWDVRALGDTLIKQSFGETRVQQTPESYAQVAALTNAAQNRPASVNSTVVDLVKGALGSDGSLVLPLEGMQPTDATKMAKDNYSAPLEAPTDAMGIEAEQAKKREIWEAAKKKADMNKKDNLRTLSLLEEQMARNDNVSYYPLRRSGTGRYEHTATQGVYPYGSKVHKSALQFATPETLTGAESLGSTNVAETGTGLHEYQMQTVSLADKMRPDSIDQRGVGNDKLSDQKKAEIWSSIEPQVRAWGENPQQYLQDLANGTVEVNGEQMKVPEDPYFLMMATDYAGMVNTGMAETQLTLKQDAKSSGPQINSLQLRDKKIAGLTDVDAQGTGDAADIYTEGTNTFVANKEKYSPQVQKFIDYLDSGAIKGKHLTDNRKMFKGFVMTAPYGAGNTTFETLWAKNFTASEKNTIAGELGVSGLDMWGTNISDSEMTQADLAERNKRTAQLAAAEKADGGVKGTNFWRVYNNIPKPVVKEIADAAQETIRDLFPSMMTAMDVNKAFAITAADMRINPSVTNMDGQIVQYQKNEISSMEGSPVEFTIPKDSPLNELGYSGKKGKGFRRQQRFGERTSVTDSDGTGRGINARRTQGLDSYTVTKAYEGMGEDGFYNVHDEYASRFNVGQQARENMQEAYKDIANNHTQMEQYLTGVVSELWKQGMSNEDMALAIGNNHKYLHTSISKQNPNLKGKALENAVDAEAQARLVPLIELLKAHITNPSETFRDDLASYFGGGTLNIDTIGSRGIAP